jgi:hypothetical protein
MLVQVAMIAFAMFGVLTMVIDLGYLRLTRVQMQNAADAAAIEGVRGRNADADGFFSDCARRTAARQLVQWTFDDNLDVNTIDAASPQNFGAGPTVAFTGGDGSSANAYQTIGDLGVYKPNLGVNQSGNAQDGDMVSGNFNPDATLRGTENHTYQRDDFTPLPPIPPDAATFQKCGDPPPATPNPTLIGADNGAFLVRLRRSAETAGPTDPADAFSTGPTLPLMFARGTTVHGDGVSGYNPRTDGLTVRGTAIARVRPALRVGLPRFGDVGVTPFELRSCFAVPLSNNELPNASIDAAGFIHPDAPPGGCPAGQQDPVGQFVVDPLTLNTVGNCAVGGSADCPIPGPIDCSTLPPQPPTAGAPDPRRIGGYGPVYQTVGASDRIVGFVRVDLSWANCAGDPTHVAISRGAGLVAASNATALLHGGLPQGIASADVKPLMTANAALGAAALLAPVLAR